MTAGIEIRNSSSNLVIDGQFQNLALSSKTYVQCSTSFYTWYMGTFVAPNNSLIAVSDPKAMVLLVSRSSSDYTYRILRPSSGSATVYVFSPLTTSSTNVGIQVFNDSGALVFDSGFKYLKVIDLLNKPNLGPAAGGTGSGTTRSYAGIGELAVIHSSPFFYGVDDSFQSNLRFYTEYSSVISMTSNTINFFAETAFMVEYQSTYPLYPTVAGGIPQFMVVDVTGY